MELKEFVSVTLTDIVQGVGSANATLEAAGWNVRFFIRSAAPFPAPGAEATEGRVEFDVAVTAASDVGGKLKGEGAGKIGLSVAGVQVKGEVEGEASKHQENVSRIRFAVLYSTYERKTPQPTIARARR